MLSNTIDFQVLERASLSHGTSQYTYNCWTLITKARLAVRHIAREKERYSRSMQEIGSHIYWPFQKVLSTDLSMYLMSVRWRSDGEWPTIHMQGIITCVTNRYPSQLSARDHSPVLWCLIMNVLTTSHGSSFRMYQKRAKTLVYSTNSPGVNILATISTHLICLSGDE